MRDSHRYSSSEILIEDGDDTFLLFRIKLRRSGVIGSWMSYHLVTVHEGLDYFFLFGEEIWRTVTWARDLEDIEGQFLHFRDMLVDGRTNIRNPICLYANAGGFLRETQPPIKYDYSLTDLN